MCNMINKLFQRLLFSIIILICLCSLAVQETVLTTILSLEQIPTWHLLGSGGDYDYQDSHPHEEEMAWPDPDNLPLPSALVLKPVISRINVNSRAPSPLIQPPKSF
jgi:hypothetical protein